MRLSSFIRMSALVLLAPGLALADAPVDAPVALQTPYHTEQEWIVSSVCRNAFELLAFAKDKKGEAVKPEQVVLKEIPGAMLGYDVTVRGAHVTAEAKLSWPGSLWSPAAYVPFCAAAAQALKLPAPAASAAQAQGNPLHALLDFSEAAIEAENHRVSQWLATEPDNAAAQEQAALILGTLAMKENSGYFWDPRDICNQVCTHLAVAQFLRGNAPVSIEGRLADILVGLIVDTKTQTGHDLDALAAEKDAPADLAAWISAARMRNTRDWRQAKSPETATPLEQVEYVRALAEAVNPDQAMLWLQAHSIPDRPDWGRIILEMNFSVDAGHTYAQQSIVGEVHAMQGTFPGSFSRSSLISDLNEPPGGALDFNGMPTVISRGMWAQFFQRHLCHAIAETGDFFANKWGVPENTQQLDQVVAADFSTLTLYPYLQLVQQRMRNSRADPTAALELFTTHPEWGPDWLVWMPFPPDPDLIRLKQAAGTWFTPPVVQGTAYGAMSRAPKGGWEKNEMNRLYAIAPLQLSVARMELSSLYGTQFTLPQFEKVMGPLADYYVVALDQAKDSIGLTFDQRVELVKKSAAINPDGYFDLGDLYKDNHQDDKAAEAYQEWFDKATDRVEVSNSVGWLVDYYYDHGQQDKAMAVAQNAAEVYSFTGLATMMHLQEKMGKLDEAESYAQKIQERYNDAGPLAAFYKRHVSEGRNQAKLDDLVLTAFPAGLKTVTLSSFSVAPDSGMCFSQTNDALRAAGLSADQVVVALDGYAVQSQAQYTFVRSLSSSPEMHFIVWDGKAYREITANQPGRRFGVDMQDYHH